MTYNDTQHDIQRPKVVVIGAGSLFFGRQAIWQMTHSEILNQGTLSFVDVDADRLEKMVTLGKMVAAHRGVSLTVEGSTDRRDVLKDADFVVLSFAMDSVKYRGIDCEVSLKYGIRMCSGDTIGPGGIFRAMRELPVIMDCVKDIRELCPNAWVINYINPSTVHGIALHRYAPDLKSFALCDSHHMPYKKIHYAIRAGIINHAEQFTPDVDQRFDFRVAGVNHFTWLLRAEYDGKDMMPHIAESLRRSAGTENDGGDTGAKALHNDTITYELYQAFGVIPTCTSHTKEYVRYWQGHGQAEESIPPLSIWETEDRYKRHEEMWQQVDDCITGRLPIQQFIDMLGPDHATDIIENMVGNLGKRFFINTLNNGAVTNMNEDAFLELLCEVGPNGVTPLHVGEMPRGIRGMQEIVLDTHELTAQAVIEQDINILRQAMLTDPLVQSIGDADGIIAELLEREQEMIPAQWYPRQYVQQ
ncbi:glycoside hydrolase family 4 [Paenibacillus sp. WLX1005]|uniref:family 4 glycosyl hydrolase n=1 Tax=Paenibacillus sp. WLX1005 TaxID=3243766 RepID=UPI0039840D24